MRAIIDLTATALNRGLPWVEIRDSETGRVLALVMADEKGHYDHAGAVRDAINARDDFINAR